jgi:hypothetical protein
MVTSVNCRSPSVPSVNTLVPFTERANTLIVPEAFPFFDLLPIIDMWLSTIWVAVSIVLTYDAHPTTGTVALCLWMLHRRWEKKSYKPLAAGKN